MQDKIKKCDKFDWKEWLSASITVRVIKSRRIEWTGLVAYMGKRIGAYRVLVGKPERKRPLGKPRCGWEDDTKMKVQKYCGGSVDCN
jgi:hypothetical protein